MLQLAAAPSLHPVVPHAEQDTHALLVELLGSTRCGISASELAGAILGLTGGLAEARRLGVAGLVDLGLLDRQAIRLLAALELGARALRDELAGRRLRIAGSSDVIAWATPQLATLDHEEVWLLSLDGAGGLLQAERIGRGGIHGCSLLPRDVLRPAIRSGASAMILVHNHPSGDPSPSPDDVAMTRALRHAAEAVGTPLLDHVIVARRGATSLADALE
ncbi:MAG: JAB domain-containing protein [Polyangiaceae bacterium]|nr:JAB domain-containing protein [Polyangiaceae bacterium]